MVQARKFVVKKVYGGLPKRSDYEIVVENLPPLQEGEFLLKAEYISVDPYLRIRAEAYGPSSVPYDQFSFQVGTVVESKNPKYPKGAKVVAHSGWRDYSVLNGEALGYAGPPYVLSEETLKGIPLSLFVGAIGMPGATAWLSFFEIGLPKPGDVLVVSGAAGAVGSLVGQIGKAMGLKVIGFAGSDAKVAWLKSLGFDYAFNYKTANLVNALKEAAPEGVDIYFDNVGGEISSTVQSQMAQYGRVVVVGAIDSYLLNQLPKVSSTQVDILLRRLTVKGFVIWDCLDKWADAHRRLANWVREGKIVAREHVTEGFDNLVEAFAGVLRGDNVGKAVVKV